MELLTCLYFVCTIIFGFGFHSSISSHVDEWTFRKWLWIYSDKYISKWPNWAEVYTIKTNEWWPISSWPLRVHKFRRDFNFRALIKRAENDTLEGKKRYIYIYLMHLLEVWMKKVTKNSKPTVCFYHVTQEFQSESTLYSLPECQKLLAQSRRHIWSLWDSNGIWTYNHWVRKRRLNYLSLNSCQKNLNEKHFQKN